MNWSFFFFLNSALLGVGLAMDAFSVSLANGLNEPNMSPSRTAKIAGVYAFFQFAMPLIGWLCVRTVVSFFSFFEDCIPWIALILLSYIGIKMIVQALSRSNSDLPPSKLGLKILIIQGIATSIDALSVGFTISKYGALMAVVCALIIAVVTFIMCSVALRIGKRAGKSLSGNAEIIGGIVLLIVGIEIFVKGMFF